VALDKYLGLGSKRKKPAGGDTSNKKQKVGQGVAVGAGEDKGESSSASSGWLWSMAGLGLDSPKKIKEWNEASECRLIPRHIHSKCTDFLQGNCTQWHRYEADMLRSREQWEVKHADFERHILSFQRTEEAWKSSTTYEDMKMKPGHQAYARRSAHIYSTMVDNARKAYMGLVDVNVDVRDRKNGELRWVAAKRSRDQWQEAMEKEVSVSLSHIITL
jgi:hypothetical protein